MNGLARQILASPEGRHLEAQLLNLSEEAVEHGQLVRLDRPSGDPSYLVWTTALVNGGPRPSYRAITIFDPAHEQRQIRQILETVFHFTNAEFRLAEQLLAGRTPAEAAAVLGVTIHTVRTYLKRLYHKVGVRTQATLMRTLLQTVQSVPGLARTAAR